MSNEDSEKIKVVIEQLKSLNPALKDINFNTASKNIISELFDNINDTIYHALGESDSVENETVGDIIDKIDKFASEIIDIEDGSYECETEFRSLYNDASYEDLEYCIFNEKCKLVFEDCIYNICIDNDEQYDDKFLQLYQFEEYYIRLLYKVDGDHLEKNTFDMNFMINNDCIHCYKKEDFIDELILNHVDNFDKVMEYLKWKYKNDSDIIHNLQIHAAKKLKNISSLYH